MKSNIFIGLVLTATIVAAGCDTNTPSPSTSNSSAPAASDAPAASNTPSGHSGGHAAGKKININSALLSELDKLEAKLGVPALSNKIQAERPYKDVNELVSKKVVTDQQFQQIKDLVTTEEIVLTGEAKDIDYAIKIALMKGHMLVAKELLAAKQPQAAEPHIGHPVEEIYTDVEAQIKERKVPEFKQVLITLQDLVKAGGKDAAKVESSFADSNKGIEAAYNAVPEAQRTSTKFVLQTIEGLLDTAGAEYAASIADGKITQPIEYQDSRGFVIVAEELYQTIAGKMAKEKPAEHAKILAAFKDLKPIWPNAIPPAKPVKTAVETTGIVKIFQQAASKAIEG
jgi:hypothetical protein